MLLLASETDPPKFSIPPPYNSAWLKEISLPVMLADPALKIAAPLRAWLLTIVLLTTARVPQLAMPPPTDGDTIRFQVITLLVMVSTPEAVLCAPAPPSSPHKLRLLLNSLLIM